jgi:hypothetical protein
MLVIGVVAYASVEDLICELVKTLNLTTTSPQGRTILYRLVVREKSGEYRALLPNLTLCDQEIELGCDLYLLPEVGS